MTGELVEDGPISRTRERVRRMSKSVNSEPVHSWNSVAVGLFINGFAVRQFCPHEDATLMDLRVVNATPVLAVPLPYSQA